MIDGEEYSSRLTTIHMQSDLALRAVTGFLKSDEAIESYLQDELEKLRKFTEEAAESAKIDPKEHWSFSKDGSNKYLEAIRENLPEKVEDVINRINQNKLLLLVAVFESFMKDIHREILKANPKALKADRKIPLGKIVSMPRDELIDEEIEREVQSLDRKNIDERYEYFDKRLNLDWFGGTMVPFVKRVMDLRNIITHEDPDLVLSEQDMGLVHLVTFSLPLGCVMQASVLYPDSFKWGDMDKEGLREVMIEQGRITTKESE